ncbi:MAG TPA: hypothetical protein VIL60_11845 [Rhodanobacter sp.]
MNTPKPPIDPSSADEQLPGEAELAELYRRLPPHAPSAALDAAVLQTAANALTGSHGHRPIERRKAPREPGTWTQAERLSAATERYIPSIEAAARARRRRAPHWLITLGSAASLVLVAGLAWHMRGSTPPATSMDRQLETMTAETGATPSAPPPAVAPTSAAPRLAKQMSAIEATAKASAARQQDSRADASEHAAVSQVAPPAPPLADQSAAEAAPREASANRLRDAAGKAATSRNGPAAAAPPARSMFLIAPDTARVTSDSPAQELRKIELLLEHGEVDEARQRLREFRQTYPEQPLPAALQAHLQDR